MPRTHPNIVLQQNNVYSSDRPKGPVNLKVNSNRESVRQDTTARVQEKYPSDVQRGAFARWAVWSQSSVHWHRHAQGAAEDRSSCFLFT